MAGRRKPPGDATDRDPTWCTVDLHRNDEPLTELCEHDTPGAGRYVVMIAGSWHCFEPQTRMQANSWVNHEPAREARMHWQCAVCNRVMPLGSYSVEAQRIRDKETRNPSTRKGLDK